MSENVAANHDYPTQLLYDSGTARLDVVVDVAPASADDLTVAADDRRIHIEIDESEPAAERTFTLPAAELRFEGDHEAFYNNGVLTVSATTVSDV